MILCFLQQFTVSASDQHKELELIGKRYATYLMNLSPDEQTIKGYLNTLDLATGAWSDIDYKCNIGSGWKSVQHSLRTSHMAMFYRRYPADNSSFTHKQLSDAIHAAWGYWFRVKPLCTTNWFPNMIAIPQFFGYSFLLLQDEMTEYERESAVSVVMKRPQISKTGSNLTYLANNVLLRSILTGDTQKAREAIDAITSTVFISDIGEEGYQEDNSYMLHGSQQQMGNYGREGLSTMNLFCNILNKTSYDLKPEQKTILADFITGGYGWFIWRGYMDINASGRQYGQDMLGLKGADILNSASRIALTLEGSQKEGVDAMINRNRSGQPLNDFVGQKSFYCSDCMTHRRPQWAASLKMHSERVTGGEQSINDNRKGKYSPDGALYTYVDGDEYENSPLFWNWHKVPGITCYDYEFKEPLRIFGGSLAKNDTKFVGTCTDGVTGISTMILNREGLFARKSWIATEDFVLCLGCDISEATNSIPLATTIDQKMQRAPLLYLDGGSWKEVTKSNKSTANRRFYHDKTGYIILDNAEVVAQVENITEVWFNISRTHACDIQSADMMTLYLKHPKAGGEYSYIITPARSRDEVRDFDTSKIEILYNTEKIQMVKYDGCYYIAAYKSGRYNLDKSTKVSISRPGLYMLRGEGGGWSVTSHDPTKELSRSEMKEMVKIR